MRNRFVRSAGRKLPINVRSARKEARHLRKDRFHGRERIDGIPSGHFQRPDVQHVPRGKTEIHAIHGRGRKNGAQRNYQCGRTLKRENHGARLNPHDQKNRPMTGCPERRSEPFGLESRAIRIRLAFHRFVRYENRRIRKDRLFPIAREVRTGNDHFFAYGNQARDPKRPNYGMDSQVRCRFRSRIGYFLSVLRFSRFAGNVRRTRKENVRSEDRGFAKFRGIRRKGSLVHGIEFGFSGPMNRPNRS